MLRASITACALALSSPVLATDLHVFVSVSADPKTSTGPAFEICIRRNLSADFKNIVFDDAPKYGSGPQVLLRYIVLGETGTQFAGSQAVSIIPHSDSLPQRDVKLPLEVGLSGGMLAIRSSLDDLCKALYPSVFEAVRPYARKIVESQ